MSNDDTVDRLVHKADLAARKHMVPFCGRAGPIHYAVTALVAVGLIAFGHGPLFWSGIIFAVGIPYGIYMRRSMQKDTL